jgi:tRNA A-37 threonylcarbamoyl transferase component Bud32
VAGDPPANDTSEEKSNPSLRATSAESSPVVPEEAPEPARPARVMAGPPPDEMLGTIYVGRYELTSIIGSGGMGVIYQGKQIFLGRTVAIKMLKNNLASVKARMRFHQEAKAASALNHPGIVAISDFGVDEKDRPYMVMEHVEGCTFADMLRERQTLTFAELLPVFLEICDALSEAHSKGIVHRDLKPSNIMLVSDSDGQVHIKLLDFGIAKMHDLQENTLQDLTKTGEALGTPLYMSPEQIMSKKVTARSDLYSLGCMMYACLTGAPPFIGQNKLDTMEKHCSAAPVPLAEAAPDLDFPSGLEPIVMSLLEKKPEDRFASIDQLKDAIVDLAVRNRLMPRLGNVTIAPGQLYKTGVIPPMPRAIAELVPSVEVISDDPQYLASGTGEGESSETIARTRGDLAVRQTATTSARHLPQNRYSAAAEDEKRKRFLLVVGLAVLFLAGTAGGVFYFLRLRQTELDRQLTLTQTAAKSPANVRVSGIAPTTPQIALPADRLLHDIVASDNGNLSEVTLHSVAGLTSKGVDELRKVRTLTTLNFIHCPINDAELKLFVGLPLVNLRLQYCPNITDFSIDTIAKFDALKGLDVSGTSIDDRGLKSLGKLTNIDSFVLDDNLKISSKGIANLFSSGSPIRLLSVNGCKIDDSCAEVLARDSELKSLDISRNAGVTKKFLEILRPVASGLTELYLSQDDCSGYSGHALAPFKKLLLLDISFKPISDDAVEDISKMKLLRMLGIFRCHPSPAQLARLQKSLQAHRGKITDHDVLRSVLGQSWF